MSQSPSRFMIGLPFEKNELEPHISEKTVAFHYDKHHAGYATNLEFLIKDHTRYNDLSLEDIITTSSDAADTAIYNNAAQVWNHNFYWNSICPPQKSKQPDQGAFFQAVLSMGGFDVLTHDLATQGMAQFGSGWAWLVRTPQGNLEVKKTSNADPIWLNSADHPLLVADVWEHAYYLDYQNRRKEHLDHFKSIINWTFAEHRFNLVHV